MRKRKQRRDALPKQSTDQEPEAEVSQKRQHRKRSLKSADEAKMPVKKLKTVGQKEEINNKVMLDDVNEIKKKPVELDACYCDEAVKARAIKDFLDNSKDLNANILIQRVKSILNPTKYSGEYVEEDDTIKIKTEPVTVKTEPFLKSEPVAIKTEYCFKTETIAPVMSEEMDDPDEPPAVSTLKATSQGTSDTIETNSQTNICKPINHWCRLSDEMALFILRMLPHEDLITVSFLNKKFRDLSRDASLWSTLAYEDIKLNADIYRNLVKRCKKLTRLEITSATSNRKSSVNIIMSVVVRTRKSLESLVFDSSIRMWTDDALKRLVKMKELRSISMTIDLSNYQKLLQHLAKLDQLEELCVKTRKEYYDDNNLRYDDESKNEWKKFKKLKKVDITVADASIVAALTSNNPKLEVLRLQYWRDWGLDYRLIDNLLLLRLRSEYPGINIERSTYYD